MNPRKHNPNNPLVQQMDGQWVKLAAVLVDKFGEVVNTSDGHRHAIVTLDIEDINAFQTNYGGEMPTIVLQEKDGKLLLVVEPESDAVERAKRGGHL